MKQLITLILALFISYSTFAQSIIERKFDHYLDRQDITHIFISGKFFDFASTIASGLETNDPEMESLIDFTSKISSFSLLRVPNNQRAMQDFKEGVQTIKSSYDELLRIKDGKNNVAVFVDGDDEVVHEVIGFIASDDEFIVMSLLGELELDKVAELIEKTNNSDVALLKKITKYNPEEFKVFPNPVNATSNLTIDIPDGMIGAKASIVNETGEVFKDFRIQSGQEEIELNMLNSGKYFLTIEKDGAKMNKSFIVIK